MAVEMKLGQYSSSASLIGLCFCIMSKKSSGYYLGMRTFSSISAYLILSVSYWSVDNFCNFLLML